MAAVAPSHPFPAAQSTATRARGPPVDPRTKPVPIPANPAEENVYRLIPEEYVPPPKEKRYRSLYADQARSEYTCHRKNAASMGPAKVHVNPTSEFLKKGSKIQFRAPGTLKMHFEAP